ncbi:hypothetical protein BDV59DRAFT_191907 [Aspergillus ambiguus]|uniref:uncharacterized protein n=1 Tax=Aspergillus ambiguus TaxID=176160 RepID=UPI003CCD08B4
MSKPSKLSKVNHAAGIYADMSVDGPAIGTLVAVVDRAKNLPNRKTMGKQNPYCAARLGKEAKKTDTDLRGGQTPKWDQELRFTVHESPDYFRLKISVFNDDKRTDLIGETWVDLKDLIIPGGGQSDQWHPLQFRGKYAGEIRIEMTYYDTRPEDEAVIERRIQAAEKVHAKSGGSAPVSSSSLSGPRQPRDVKRRPLPSDPPGAPPRPTITEKAPSAPLPLPQQPISRPLPNDSAPPAPPADYGHHSRHPVAPDMPPYDAPVYGPPPTSRPVRNYETPDDFHRDWNQAPTAPPPLSGSSKRMPQDPYYPSHREKPVDAYDSRSYARPRSGYGNMPPADFRYSRPDIPVTRAEQYIPEPAELPPTAEPPRPSSHHSNYHFPTVEPYPPGNEMVPQGHSSRYRPRSSGGMQEPAPLEYAQRSGPVERDHYYRPHSNSLVHDPLPIRPPPSRDGYHAEYATMQPRVEDEEEEGPPPPPPVHRSGVGQSSQQLVPSPTSPYQAYSPEYASPHPPREINMGPPSHPSIDGGRMHDMPLQTSESYMPPSLVAGFDPIVADAESDRAVAESQSRRQSAMFEDDQMMPPREPSPVLPPYPVDHHSASVDERRPIASRGSATSETRIVPRKSVSPGPLSVVPRKSISPRPSSSGGHEPSQMPFSPDSFDAFNPNAARSAMLHDPAPAYDTPAQAMDAARRSEAEAGRDPGPIYDDEGKEIDPSDHLPTDTWAPEPERKNTKKPGVVVRFRNAPARTGAKPQVPAKEWGPPRSRPAPMGTTRRPQSYAMPDMMRGRPPTSEMSHGRDPYGSYGHGRTYSTPNATTPSPQSSFRGSASPGRSPSRLYEPANPGPPIPAKVPIAAPPAPSQAFPVSGSRGGMDALSRELGTIDIGGVGCNNGRAIRKYVPKITTGYAI